MELELIIDISPGQIIIRDAQSILGIVNDLYLTPHEARVIAKKLEADGEHTTAADGLRQAADQAEQAGMAS